MNKRFQRMMKLFLASIFFIGGAIGLNVSVFAQTYPNKPIKIIVPATAGGGADFIARTLSVQLGE